MPDDETVWRCSRCSFLDAVSIVMKLVAMMINDLNFTILAEGGRGRLPERSLVAPWCDPRSVA